MIQSLRLQNFRSYLDASFEFGNGVNIIVGPNGSGKTNLLEAIQMVAIGASYRASDNEMLGFGQEWFRLDALLNENDASRVVKFQTVPKHQSSYEIDEKKISRLLERYLLPVVIFEPNHLQLLHSSPDLRRAYLDDILEYTMPGYRSFRKNYRRVLFQRNSLLKRGRVSTEEMFPWNLRLSELGAVMSRARAELCEKLSKELEQLYKTLSTSDETVTITYKPQFPVDKYETTLMHHLEKSLDHEMMRGFTAYGPHREDFITMFSGRLAKELASRGETRTVVLALKIIELQLIEGVSGARPILLFDDVFSELDGARRRALTKHLQTHQSFLTTTDADVVIKHFTDSTIIPLG